MIVVKPLDNGRVAQLKDWLRECFRQNFPEATGTDVDSMLLEVMKGRAVMWAIYDMQEDSKKVFAIFTTAIHTRWASQRLLYIGNLVSSGDITVDQWQEALSQLVQYAKDNRCATVEADSNLSRMGNLAEKFGFYQVSTRWALGVQQ